MHQLQPLAHAIRFLAVDAILAAGEGHQGVPLGMAEIATALYTQHLKHDPKTPTWFDRDRVVLSNGHGSMLLYALLYLSGYDKISLDQIKNFRKLGSHCAGHPEYDPAAGIEVTTGQLGQGIGNALGMAVAEAHLRAQFGADLVHHYTYAFVGDGCLQEGVGQEMIALAGHLGLGHLILLWDDNEITDDGATHLSISENVVERFRVANWHVVEVDGHNIDAVSRSIAKAKLDPRPSMIACKTTIAKGVARLQGQRGGHSGKLFPQDRTAMQAMFDLENQFGESFAVPGGVLNAWRDSSDTGVQAKKAWDARVAALPKKKRMEFERILQGALPQNIDAVIAQLKADLSVPTETPPALGGINLSAAIHHALTPSLPERMTACADLEAPTDHKRGQLAFTNATPAGSYVHCGVREHVMGAMCNGMAAHGGVLPVAVTYLVFSDYLRPAMRNAALMGLPVKFVFSHDSIGIGTNGPTHQPVEILASLRAMPNMLVLRPADAVEAVECWEIALKHKSGPVSLIFARQVLPLVRTSMDSRLRGNDSSRGGYVISESQLGARQVTLLSTGSEVAIALDAQKLLEAGGIATAVVSIPCFELFDAQDAAYRQATLGMGCTRVAVEAAVVQGWERYLGEDGAFIGMTGFGLSGSAKDLYAHFGITAEAVVAKAKHRLKSVSGISTH